MRNDRDQALEGVRNFSLPVVCSIARSGGGERTADAITRLQLAGHRAVPPSRMIRPVSPVGIAITMPAGYTSVNIRCLTPSSGR